MLIVQAKGHGTEDDIQALQQHVVMGMDFSNILFIDFNRLPLCGFGQPK